MNTSSPELPDGKQPITQWVRDLEQPDQRNDAATKISEKYQRLLQWRIAKLIGDEVRGKVEQEDVVQEALDTFFRRRTAGQYEIADRGELLELLEKIATNKLVSHVRGEQADKRTPGQADAKTFAARYDPREEPPNAEKIWDANVTQQELEAGKKVVSYPDEELKRNYRKALPIDSDVPPGSEFERAEAAQFLNDLDPVVRATWAEALETLPDNLRLVFLMAVQGFNDKEISERLDIEMRAVQRRRKLVKKHLQSRIK